MTILREPAPAPVQGTERMEALDAVRGAAILGILLANVVAMSGFPFLAPDHYRSLPLADWHEPAFFVVLFLIEAKFYSLFSLLSGSASPCSCNPRRPAVPTRRGCSSAGWSDC